MYKNIATQTLRKPLLKSKPVSADVLRLDLVHPVVSGNKWFKLKYHIINALQASKKGLVSFGGAYSNHLVAMAAVCKEQNLLSTGIVRGEETFSENESIRQMKEYGMQVLFAGRDEYRNKDALIKHYLSVHDEFYYVPEGGQSSEGIKGASEILSFAKQDYTHIVCAVGTGTTMAGLVNASHEGQHLLGISCLKVADKNSNDLLEFLYSNTNKKNYSMQFDYHFGGYAKKTDELIAFMNSLFTEEHIATDFVYTGKMFYAVYDLVQNDYFPIGSNLLLIHTGGLQGNRSLPSGTLVF